MPRANRHDIPGYVRHITHRCHKKEFLLYIDLNMVRAGLERHPSGWPFSGYNEILGVTYCGKLELLTIAFRGMKMML